MIHKGLRRAKRGCLVLPDAGQSSRLGGCVPKDRIMFVQEQGDGRVEPKRTLHMWEFVYDNEGKKVKDGGRQAPAAHGEAGFLIAHKANGAHLRCKR